VAVAVTLEMRDGRRGRGERRLAPSLKGTNYQPLCHKRCIGRGKMGVLQLGGWVGGWVGG